MKYAYKKGVIEAKYGCWFVFDKGGVKVKVCLSEKEARDFCDWWEKVYGY